MATPKISAFDAPTVQLAEWAKALGHPARIAILRILVQKKACVCGTLVDELPLSQATVSQHLKVLKAARIIQGNIDGPRVCYCIDSQTWKALQGALGGFFETYSSTSNCC